jgi:hypothetical protein
VGDPVIVVAGSDRISADLTRNDPMQCRLDLHARGAPSAAPLAPAPIPRFPGVGAFLRNRGRFGRDWSRDGGLPGLFFDTLRGAHGKKVVFVGDLERYGFGLRVF